MTVVDTSTPTIVLDEVDLQLLGGRLFHDGATSALRHDCSYSGKNSLELCAHRAGKCRLVWEPVELNCHETDFVRFAYKKTSPTSKVGISWTGPDGREFVATDGELNGRQEWTIPNYGDTDFHEVVLSFSEMEHPAAGNKSLPRVDVLRFEF